MGFYVLLFHLTVTNFCVSEHLNVWRQAQSGTNNSSITHVWPNAHTQSKYNCSTNVSTVWAVKDLEPTLTVATTIFILMRSKRWHKQHHCINTVFFPQLALHLCFRPLSVAISQGCPVEPAQRGSGSVLCFSAPAAFRSALYIRIAEFWRFISTLVSWIQWLLQNGFIFIYTTEWFSPWATSDH